MTSKYNIQNLSPLSYAVTQQGETEPPFTGALLNNKKTGNYDCIVCGTELFHSNSKYESGSGWPSFWEPVNEDAIEYIQDNSLGMIRTEVKCANCQAHLGHMFDDGPSDKTGLRYCINSAALKFATEADASLPKLEQA